MVSPNKDTPLTMDGPAEKLPRLECDSNEGHILALDTIVRGNMISIFCLPSGPLEGTTGSIIKWSPEGTSGYHQTVNITLLSLQHYHAVILMGGFNTHFISVTFEALSLSIHSRTFTYHTYTHMLTYTKYTM